MSDPIARPGTEFILIMATLMSVVAISIDAMLPALGIIGEDLGVSYPNQPQLIISFIFIGMALGQLICGPLSDAIGRKKILYGSLVVYLAGSLICLFSPSIELMLFGRFIQGLGVSGPYISCSSIVRDKYSGRAMARVMSLIMMIFIMVPTIAPALGQGILFLADWRAIFFLYIIYAIGVLVWISFRLEETLPVSRRVPFKFSNLLHGLRTVFSNQQTVFYTICAGLVFGALIGYLNSCQQIFQDYYGAGNLFALYFAMQALLIAVSSLLNSKIVERFGMRYMAARALGVVMFASIIFLVVSHYMEPTLWMFMGYIACVMFSFGLLFGNLNAMALEPMGAIAGLAAAIIGSFSSFMSLTLGTLIGQLYDGTLVPINLGFLVLSTTALLTLFLAEKAQKAGFSPR